MTMTMNRCKPILSSQTVNLLWSSSSSQANTSMTSRRQINTNQGGEKKNNSNNLWLAVGTATAASALAYKLFQDRDRSTKIGFSLSETFIE